jgi:hypothetical protein
MKFVKERATDTYMLIEDAVLTANPELYIDHTPNPYYLHKYYSNAGLTFWQARYEAKELVDSLAGGFNDLPNDEDKEAMSLFAYGDKGDIHSFLETYHGVDAATAQGMNLQRSAAARVLLAADAKVILSSPKIMEIGVKYLSQIVNGEFDSSQAFQLTEALDTFFSQYGNFAVLGTDYDDEVEGLMDYLESTHNYSSGGAKNYDLNPAVVNAMPGPSQQEKEDQALAAMVAEFQDLFVKGNA